MKKKNQIVKNKDEKPSTMEQLKEIVKKDEQQLLDLFGDVDLVIFFAEYLANDRNSTKAYAAMYPDRYDLKDKKQYQVCAIMGHRLLKRINILEVMDQYDLGASRYLRKIDDGLEATSTHVVLASKGAGKGRRVVKYTTPNHAVQLQYHTKLGKLLKLESDGVENQNNTQVNVNFSQAFAQASKERGLQP